MVEAGGVPRPRDPVRERGQAEQWSIPRSHHGVNRVAADPMQTEPLVEGNLAWKVEDLQLEGAERPVSQRSVPVVRTL